MENIISLYASDKLNILDVVNAELAATVADINKTMGSDNERGKLAVGTFPLSENRTLVIGMTQAHNFPMGALAVWQHCAFNYDGNTKVPVEIQAWKENLSRDSDDVRESFTFSGTVEKALVPADESKFYKVLVRVNTNGTVDFGAVKPSKITF